MQTSIQSIYPAGPSFVPENLTRATPRYKRHAWLAVAALLLFVALYLGLALWFCVQTWHMFNLIRHGGQPGLSPFVVGALSAALALFMIKGLFVVKHSGQSREIELHAADQPDLFAFLHRLADEAGSPRPHRIFLSEGVNAAVFYDLSIVNLLFPTRKNLLIGLGLVNVLTIGEFKAVLAHEFGHFAQRSMAVGRWVYIAQQIAGHLVAQRDAFDKFINGLSRVDIRIAWIGWLLSLLVWSVRSIVELSFRLLLIAERALSREMEMQADLVAVSLTGSDALIHALYKTGPAESAWNRALLFANTQYAKNRRIGDLFTIQARVVEHMRVVHDDVQYGRVPAVPPEQPAAHRVFKADFARPPAMWATHPLNHEREENAKRAYVSAPIDERPAWTIFGDVQAQRALRIRVSQALLKDEASQVPMMSDEEACENLDMEFRREYLNRFYRSSYLARSVVRSRVNVDELYDRADQLPPEALKQLYPPSLSGDLEALRELQRETAMLKAIEQGIMHTAGNAAYFRGRPLRRKDLPGAIAQAESDLAQMEQKVLAHDRLCRTAHLVAAKTQGGNWETYLKSVLSLMHYADHCAADLRDIQGLTSNVYQVVTAGGKLNEEKFNRLLSTCQSLFHCLSAVYVEAGKVQPGPAILTRLEAESWQALLGEFRFAAPDRNNINDWLRNVDSWINACIAALNQLYEAALGELLKTEAALSKATLSGTTVEAAPDPAQHPSDYPRLVPGSERPRQKARDWWSRFQSADGAVATTAKFVVAAAFIVAILAFGALSGRAELTIFNGLDNSVQVKVGGRQIDLAPRSFADITLPLDTDVEFASRIGDVEIERFVEHLDQKSSHYLYNITRAAAFVEWTAIYGARRQAPPARFLGNPRWSEVVVDDMLKAPPQTLSSNAGDSRTVLASLSDKSPIQQLNSVGGSANDAATAEMAQAMAFSHARFDTSNSENLMMWMSAVRDKEKIGALLAARLHINPRDVMALRMEQDQAGGIEHAGICRRDVDMAQQQPANPDLQYLKIRCQPAGPAQDRDFVDAAQRWPANPWLQMAAGYVALDRLDLEQASHRFSVTTSALPIAREWLYLDLARGRRLLDPDASLNDLVQASSQLQAVNNIEHGARDAEFDRVWDGLLRGDIKAAHALLPTNQTVSRQGILIAASDGAEPAWAQAVLGAVPDASWQEDSLMFALALAMREKRDTTPYVSLIAERSPAEIERVMRFMQAVQIDKTKMPQDDLNGMNLSWRGQAYAMALIVRGKSAPQAWRDGAKRLLFKVERPYFG